MNKVKLLVVYPIDPSGEKVGGIETAIRTYIKGSPENFVIDLVGVTKNNSELRVCEWQDIIFEGRKIRFFPLIKVKDPNDRTLIPLTLKFVVSLFFYKNRINFRERIIVFHRLEPMYVLSNVKGIKILFIHGDIRYFGNRYCESKWRRIRYLYYFFEHIFIKKIKKIFVVSQKGCEYYKSKYPEYSFRFKFLPTWYNPVIFHKVNNIRRKEILSKYKILDDRPIILFVGRLEQAKNPLLLIDSFSLIVRAYPDSQLVIIGEGSLKEKIIKKIYSLSLEKKVFFLNRLSQTEIARIMNISDLLLSTSRFEGMPRVVLESLACGLPVVATNVGENYLVVKDWVSGKLISSFDPKEFAEAVVALISNLPSPRTCMKVVKKYKEQKVLYYLFKEIEVLKD
jgi:glycosyltransferase involved in cell wall biosynthesis